MQLTFLTFLIVMPLSLLGGFVEAVSGGGGLITLPAYMIAGVPTHYAIATNKLGASMGLSLATFRFARNGYINWKRAAFCPVAALIGGSLGARLNLLIDDHYLKIIMLFLLPATAIYVMRSRALSDDKEELSPARTVIISCLVALVVGTYDGFYGPGSGTFMILLLTGAAHMKLQEANGTAKVINLATCLSSFVVYLINGKVLIPLGIAAGAMHMTGTWIGTKMFDKDGAKVVKPLIIVVIAIFFIKIITELI